MKKEKDYIQDIAEIRSMMEKSSKFLSLSGWAGILAGLYALAGVFIVWKVFDFTLPEYIFTPGFLPHDFENVVVVAMAVLLTALITALILSRYKAGKRGEKAWNATSKRLLVNMSVPLVTGGLLVIMLIAKGFIGMIVPLTLVFYGLALYNAGRFTYNEVRIMGLVDIVLGLAGFWFIEYALLFWAAGFGVVHIIYGIYMYYRYKL